MIDYALFTNQGERPNNEDYVGYTEVGARKCFVLCDGLGGHGNGEVASQLVVNSILEDFKLHLKEKNWIKEAVRSAQAALLAKQKEENDTNGMKTTLVVLDLDENFAKYTHVGDSRGYYFYKNKYKLRTIDHSVPQMLVESHRIKEKDIRNHPDRNRLLRVMGVEWDDDKFETGEEIFLKVGKRHAFFLCSDGFWELITEKEMESCLKAAASARDWINRMQEIVLKNGTGTNMDNYSAIAVIIEE